jgi:uncharacterized protein YutE (UPF0331/DUF86 family)
MDFKRAGGELYPAFPLPESLNIVCNSVDALTDKDDERIWEILEAEGITEEEYEKALPELESISDAVCSETLELDP